MPDHKFHPPVFVRSDDTTTIEASLIEWDYTDGDRISIKLANSNESILINSEDWAAIKSTVDYALNQLR